MNLASRQLLQSALALDESERAEIAASLIQSLEPPVEANDDYDAAWAVEIKRRLDSIDNAEVKLIAWDEVMHELSTRPIPLNPQVL